MNEVRWFVSPAITVLASDGTSLRYNPSMMDEYPGEQWSGAISNNRDYFLLRWVASESFDVSSFDGIELITDEQWATLYMQYPELRSHWKDQPMCRVL